MQTSLPQWVDQVKQVWTIIGVLITTIGVKLPAFIPSEIFAADFISLGITALGACITVVQVFRKYADPVEELGTLRTLSVPDSSARTAFKFNPFKLRLVKQAA